MTEEEYKRWKERLRGSLSVEQRESLDAQVEKTTRPEPIQETEVVTPAISPEVLEARQIAEQELSTGQHITGTALGVSAELGVGLALTHKLHRSQKYLQWLNNAKRVSTVGILAPEPTTTIGGVVGLAASEAAIWATSNFIGQKIRQAYGLQDKVSGGEMIAASVFGVGLVTKAADKVFRLGPGVGAANAWKGREMLVNGTKTFVSGAALGLAESAMRQEIEAQLNGKDRDEYDYLFSSLAGGTFNSLFSVWSRTGKWGRGKAAEAAENAKARLDKDIDDLKERLKEGRGRGSQFKIKKEIATLEQSKELIDDSINEIKTADEALSKQETNPKEVEDIDEPLIKKEEEVVEEPGLEEIPRSVDDEREDAFDVLRDRVSKITKDNVTTELPLIEREAKKVYNRTYRNLNDLTRKLAKNADDTETIEAMLSEVQFFRKLNTEVKDIAETTGGRTLQAARRDADKYRWLSKYSYRSRLEDAALAKLEVSLEAKLGRTLISEDADIKSLFDDFVKIKPRIKEAGKAIDEKVTRRAKARKKKEVTEEQKAANLKKAVQTKLTKLQKELDELRARFGDDIALEEAAAKVKKKKPKDPKQKDLEDRIKYYKEVEAEVAKIEQLEANLARVADIEARGVISELRAEVAPKPKGPTKPSKVKELQKKISDSKKRMKQKLADLDRTVVAEAKEKQNARLYADMEQAFFAALEADVATKGTKFIRGVKQARQMALIDQLPSVFAGVPTGIGAGFKQFFRVPATWLSNLDKGLPIANKMAHIEAASAFKMLTDLNGLGESMRRTFAENLSATDRRAGKLADEISTVGLPRGEHALIAKAARDAKRRAEAVDNVAKSLGDFVIMGKYHQILSLGVRGIQTVDDVFKRQIIKSRIYSESNKKALLEFPNDPAKQKQRAEELYNSAWVDSDGLEVLNDTHEFMDEVNQVREELLFASNTDDLQDVYINSSEKLINNLKELSNDDGLLGFGINAFLPYIGVPIRAVYRGARLVAAPAKRSLGLLEASPFELPKRIGETSNPYNKIIRNIELEMDVVRKQLAKPDLDDAAKASFQDEFNLLDDRLKTASVRRAKYNNELLTDALIAMSIGAIGYLGATSGNVTGSLAWMTDDQRKKTGMESFKAFGSDYSAALPWSFPLAFMADWAAFERVKEIEEREGIKILTKDQNRWSVLKQSLIQLSKAMPLAEGVKNFEEIVGGEGEVLTSAFTRLVASYVPVPAQARKIVQAYEANGDAAIADLRGGTFYDRVMYSVLGIAPLNKKTDLLGNDLVSNKTIVTEAIIRQAPRRQKQRSDFEKIVATDTHGNIRRKPSTLYPGIRMTEFRNSDGMTLSYAFDRRLRDTQVRIRGKKRFLEDAVYDLIYSKRWNKKFDKGFVASETNPDVLVNEGLRELDSLLQKFYKQTQKDMLKDSSVLDDFINKDDVSLFEIMETMELQADETGRPISILEIFSAD
jgi:hypothetical protein